MSNIDKRVLRHSAESIIGILENIAGFESSDIDGDSVELRFETEDGFDTGCDVSIVDQCQKTADVVRALLDELEAAEKRIDELESLTAPQLPQPALVVTDEMTPKQASRSYCGEVLGYRDGWNDCRAAMLQSGNFRENNNSSTNNFREIAETSTNYPLIPGEVLSAILNVAKIRADFDDFDGDRRGIGDFLDEAEQELIVTINKYASQLAAEPIATNDVREQTAVPPVPVIHADVAQAIEKLKRKLVECNRYNYCADAVKGVEYACRAAMLHSAEPVSQAYKLNALDGNSPVIPDGWVMVPKELTPEMMRAVQIRSELGGYATSNLSGAYNMFSEFWNVAVSAAPKVDDL